MNKRFLYFHALGWLVLAFWLYVGMLAKAGLIPCLLGPVWFALSAFSPAAFYVSLIPALALFGNNPGGPHALYLIDMAMMGLVAGHMFRRARRTVEPRASSLDVWVALFVFWSWLSLIPQARFLWVELAFKPAAFLFAIFNHYVNAQTYGLQCALKLSLAAGMFVQIRDQPWENERIVRWLKWAVAVLVLTAIAGLGNYLGFVPLAWWRGENVDILRFNFPRLQSIYWHSGWYAEYVEALAPAAMVLAWHARGGRRAIAWAFVGLLALVTLLTMQRAGWLGLTAGFAAVVACTTWMKRNESGAWVKVAMRIGAVVAVLLVLALSVAALSRNFRHRAAELVAYQHRTLIWKGALGFIQIRPAAGIGLGNYHRAHLDFYPGGHPIAQINNNFKSTAHNLYLHIAAERGLIGFGLFVPILVIAGMILAREMGKNRQRTEPGHSERIVPIAIAGGLTALLVDGLFQYSFYVRTIEVLFWLMLGWTAGLRPEPVKNRRAWILPAASIVIIAASLWFYRAKFEPWMHWVGDRNYLVAGKKVSIEIPPGAQRIELPIASIDPMNHRYPVKITVKANNRVLAEESFTTQSAQILNLNVKDMRGPLELEASRDFSPFANGNRTIPVRRVGVLYLPPTKK